MRRELSTEEAYGVFKKAFFDCGCNVVFVDDIEMEMSQGSGWRGSIMVVPVKFYDADKPTSRFTVPTRAFHGTAPKFKVFKEDDGRLFFERERNILNGYLRFCKKVYEDMTSEVVSGQQSLGDEEDVRSVVDEITNTID